MEMMDVGLNMFETTFQHALATLDSAMCWPRFIGFKSLAWAVTEPCASDQRFIAIWNWSQTPVQWAQQVWGPQVLITARSRWISLLLLANERISIGMVVMKGSSSSSQIKCEQHKASKGGIRPCLEIFVWTIPIKFGESNHEIGARKYYCWQWKGPPKQGGKQDSRSWHPICSNSMCPWVRQLENKRFKNTMNEVWRWYEVSWHKPTFRSHGCTNICPGAVRWRLSKAASFHCLERLSPLKCSIRNMLV